ncbi:MAG TPA: hypothetical protein VGS07_16630 [Thermoanaerobaculia bacterium]|jgi:hypothetical protein|nr:hypothetical protein [Thermoanaerobaculia bacterium]
MSHHVSTEDLSTYLDSELGYAEVAPLEAHCASCADCGSRLASMRRVVHGLGSIHRAEPPAALRHQIRREVQTAPPVSGFAQRIGWAFESLRILLFPVRPTLRASAAFGLAAVAGLFAVSHGMGDAFLRADDPQPRQPIEIVETHLGEPLALPPQTTSEVAGRKFIWTDAGWVQRGLEGETPETRLDAHSPQGKALLTKCSGLQFLLEDGSAVVLRYNLETVEIRSIPPVTRILSSGPQPGRGHVPSVSA